jgi:Ca-activated chloride channel homolog
VRGYVQEGVRLTTVGVGMGNFNDVLLERLANDGDGSYAYIDTFEEAQRLFVDNLVSTLQVIALDAKVQVEFNPELVYYYRLLGYENRDVADHDFRNDRVDAGEVGAGQNATAVYEVQLAPGARGWIATMKLRWQDPDTYQVQEISQDFSTWDLESDFHRSAPRYRLAVLAANYAEYLRESSRRAAFSLPELARMAVGVAEELYMDADVVEFADLVQRASRLERR